MKRKKSGMKIRVYSDVGLQLLGRIFIKDTTVEMEFDQKSEGDEPFTWISRRRAYVSEDTSANALSESNTDMFYESKEVIMTET